jgi:chemotaxis signal transduction protein
MEALCFSVGGSAYLAPLVSLAEVLMPAALRPVPAAPPFVLGLLHLRGRTLTVIDLRERLGLAPREGFAHANRILRVGAGGQDLGVVVDAVLRIAVLEPSQRRDGTPGVGIRQGWDGPLWELDGALVQELRLEQLLDGAALSALGSEPAHGQTDFNRLLDPSGGGSDAP